MAKRTRVKQSDSLVFFPLRFFPFGFSSLVFPSRDKFADPLPNRRCHGKLASPLAVFAILGNQPAPIHVLPITGDSCLNFGGSRHHSSASSQRCGGPGSMCVH